VDLTPGLRRVPPPDLEAVGQNEDLAARIRDEIRRDGPITFARFMDLALYDPDDGYYRSDDARPGRAGDFLTAPETHPIFGSTISRFVDETWHRLARPSRFIVREHGAGEGALATSILGALRDAHSDILDALRYQPVEVDPRRVAAFEYHVSGVGIGAVVEPGDTRPITGIVLANEVLDALPVHRVVQRGDELLEIRVGLDGTRFIDVETAPSTPSLFVRLAAEDVTLTDGQRAEVCLAVDDWVAQAATGLGRGILLLIDYGYPAVELYDPVRRRDGTLRAYVRHTVHDDPYAHVGRQDLTAHVDVDAVVRAAEAAGLTHLGTTTQAEFLVGLGMDERLRAIQADPTTTMEAYLAVRSAVMRLLDPAATGRFRVMAFGRDWAAGPPLAAFAYRLPARSSAPRPSHSPAPPRTPPD
jgi:SAM-dependent MidA family methyltransferase